MNITIYGSGYVGLVTAACLAEAGNHTLCVDIDEDRVARLRRGELPICEPGLKGLLQRGLAAGRLQFATDVTNGVEFGPFQFIAVGTPSLEDGSVDLQYVLSVARSIGRHMNASRIIVNKSTVPVGTADRVRATVEETLRTRGVDLEFDVIANPEFLREGAAVADFMKPDRIIVGADNSRAAESLKSLYEPFNRNHDRVIMMDPRSAELTKYAANAMLATRISFMNEMAGIAERFGADIESVRVGIGSDPRIGYGYIYPGIGFGGSCLPKDVRALASSSEAAGHPLELMQAVQRVNMRQRRLLFDRISSYFDGQLEGRVIALWGLSFKPNTDDMREASSRALMEALWEAGCSVRAYDPVAMDAARRIYPDQPRLLLCPSAEDAVKGADALAVATEWREFRSPDFGVLKASLKTPVIFDGRNVYEPEYLKQIGFEYFGVGRGAPTRA
ncbi:MAG: UDP-glucose/GDP-mannose dehydrogenase family protein [Proteobacteria bacterium]|nr:UDP-glucose/GDP-mannose dehydrogenase family protein [Pseudomonadota bacterium]MYJ94726.1 UDP-glucose/GDP-mannose dehydrogenase family protein [Pseudomonadota bacterium]